MSTTDITEHTEFMAMSHLESEQALTNILSENIDKKEDNLSLVYIRPVSKNLDKIYEYDFFFSDTPDIVWGPDWDVPTPSVNGDLTPDPTTYKLIKKVKTTMPIKTAEETSCHAMEYTIYGIMPLGWIDIENMEEYPENGRIPMYFGEKSADISHKLSLYGWSFTEENPQNLS